MDNKHQKIRLALTQETKGEAKILPVQRNVLTVALKPTESLSELNNLMERICGRENLKQALARICRNKGERQALMG